MDNKHQQVKNNKQTMDFIRTRHRQTIRMVEILVQKSQLYICRCHIL